MLRQLSKFALQPNYIAVNFSSHNLLRLTGFSTISTLTQLTTKHLNASHRFQRPISTTMASEDQDSKRFKEGDDRQLVIGTHDGIFHCDEVLACFMLQQLPHYANASVTRTRDDKVLAQCDIVVDVGAVFDSEKHRFDHHQASFKETLNSLRPEVKVKREVR